jgi:hypothetical protein
MRRGRSRDPCANTAFWSRYGVSISSRLLLRFCELRISRLRGTRRRKSKPQGERCRAPRPGTAVGGAGRGEGRGTEAGQAGEETNPTKPRPERDAATAETRAEEREARRRLPVGLRDRPRAGRAHRWRAPRRQRRRQHRQLTQRPRPGEEGWPARSLRRLRPAPSPLPTPADHESHRNRPYQPQRPPPRGSAYTFKSASRRSEE